MTGFVWLLLFAIAAAFGWLIWRSVRKWQARRLAEEERFANFMKASAGAPAPNAPAPPSAAVPSLPAATSITSATPAIPAMPATAAGNNLAQQKLLFDAAHKAGEAGEPAIAIQLYARLLARYPATTLADPARAAVEAQKRKLLKT